MNFKAKLLSSLVIGSILSINAFAFEVKVDKTIVKGVKNPESGGVIGHWSFTDIPKDSKKKASLKAKKFVNVDIADTNGKVLEPIRVDAIHYAYIFNDTDDTLYYSYEVNVIAGIASTDQTGHIVVNPHQKAEYNDDVFVTVQLEQPNVLTTEGNIFLTNEKIDDSIEARKNAKLFVTN